MMENEPTKDLTENLTDRQILLGLRQSVGELNERVAALESRTNPLPPNYEARFTALEEQVAGIAEQQHELAKGQRRLERQLQLVQRDFFEQRTNLDDLQERVERLEHRAN